MAERAIDQLLVPPVRPEFEPAPKRDGQPLHRSGRRNESADKKSKTESKKEAKTDWRTKTSDPIGVVTFLKKLVTPDKTTRKPAVEAEADPPSHVQPPQ